MIRARQAADLQIFSALPMGPRFLILCCLSSHPQTLHKCTFAKRGNCIEYPLLKTHRCKLSECIYFATFFREIKYAGCIPFPFLYWIYILSNHYNIAVTTPNFPALQKYTFSNRLLYLSKKVLGRGLSPRPRAFHILSFILLPTPGIPAGLLPATVPWRLPPPHLQWSD